MYKIMPLDFNEIIKIAELLHQLGVESSDSNIDVADIDKEAFKRSIINRAYYGAFILARNYSGLKYNTDRSIHRDVLDFFIYSKNDKCNSIANKLYKLKEYRVCADYHCNWDHEEKLDIAVKAAIGKAQAIKNTLLTMTL